MKSKHVAVIAVAVLGMVFVPSRSKAQAPSDPQIVGIVIGADDIDINYAKIALKKSKEKGVRDFAQQMVTDHSAVQKSVKELAGKLGVTPEDSDTSKGLKAKSDEITKQLNALKDKAFDKFYIDNEVAYHKLVTDAVSGMLIPSAKNAELKSALEGAQPLFLGHLEHAKNVQAAVSSDSMMKH